MSVEFLWKISVNRHVCIAWEYYLLISFELYLLMFLNRWGL